MKKTESKNNRNRRTQPVNDYKSTINFQNTKYIGPEKKVLLTQSNKNTTHTKQKRNY